MDCKCFEIFSVLQVPQLNTIYRYCTRDTNTVGKISQIISETRQITSKVSVWRDTIREEERKDDQL